MKGFNQSNVGNVSKVLHGVKRGAQSHTGFVKAEHKTLGMSQNVPPCNAL